MRCTQLALRAPLLSPAAPPAQGQLTTFVPCNMLTPLGPPNDQVAACFKSVTYRGKAVPNKSSLRFMGASARMRGRAGGTGAGAAAGLAARGMVRSRD